LLITGKLIIKDIRNREQPDF